MTEAEWLASADTLKLRRFLARPLSYRKCLLAVCAYGRRIEKHVPYPQLAELLRTCEAGADAIPMATIALDEVSRHRDEMIPSPQATPRVTLASPGLRRT